MQHSKIRGGRQGFGGKLRASGGSHDNASSRSTASRSPKVADHRARAPTLEKKRVARVSELETQLAQLQDEVERFKVRLSESESSKRQARQEAEEAKKRLAAVSAKLDESQQQLDELWACEESRIQELRKVSQDRDRAWEAELEAVRKHHSMDTAALAAAMTENQKLKILLQKATRSAQDSDSAHEEVQTLRLELSETHDLVQELKTQLNDSEARALELVGQTEKAAEGRDGEAAANAEMESELRRLKVQTEQWRKAAEVAAAIVLGNGGSDGRPAEGPESNSPYSEDIEDESSSKKTSNMLKKMVVLLKKGQK